MEVIFQKSTLHFLNLKINFDKISRLIYLIPTNSKELSIFCSCVNMELKIECAVNCRSENRDLERKLREREKEIEEKDTRMEVRQLEWSI